MPVLARKAQKHLTSLGVEDTESGLTAQPSPQQREAVTGRLLTAVPMGTETARGYHGMGKRTQETHSLGQIKALALTYSPTLTTLPFSTTLTLSIQSFPGWPEGLTHQSPTSLLQIRASPLRKHPMLQ